MPLAFKGLRDIQSIELVQQFFTSDNTCVMTIKKLGVSWWDLQLSNDSLHGLQITQDGGITLQHLEKIAIWITQ